MKEQQMRDFMLGDQTGGLTFQGVHDPLLEAAGSFQLKTAIVAGLPPLPEPDGCKYVGGKPFPFRTDAQIQKWGEEAAAHGITLWKKASAGP